MYESDDEKRVLLSWKQQQTKQHEFVSRYTLFKNAL